MNTLKYCFFLFFLSQFLCLLVMPSYGQERVLITKNSKPIITLPLQNEFNSLYSGNNADTIQKSVNCECEPSLPLEIGLTSIVWGIPSYLSYRFFYDKHFGADSVLDGGTLRFDAALFILTPFLLMYSLGPIAELTSGCEVSYWHAFWIGFGTATMAAAIYGSDYGSKHPQDIKTFNLREYLWIGVAPSIASAFIFNIFLHPRSNKNQTLLIFPSIGYGNQASLNIVGRF